MGHPVQTLLSLRDLSDGRWCGHLGLREGDLIEPCFEIGRVSHAGHWVGTLTFLKSSGELQRGLGIHAFAGHIKTVAITSKNGAFRRMLLNTQGDWLAIHLERLRSILTPLPR